MASPPTHGQTPGEPRPEEGQHQLHRFGGRIDLNHANKEQIMAATGLDREVAEKIVRFRDERGGFKTWRDLEDLPIDEACREKLRPYVRL